MRVRVVEAYERPYDDPLAVAAGAAVVPDFKRCTEYDGWVWCTAADGRSGWTPLAWLTRDGEAWRIDRDYDSAELTIAIGEELTISLEESGFVWAVNARGEAGWVPSSNVVAISRG